MKFLSYDIEIYDEIEGDKIDIATVKPSVAAYCTTEKDTKFYEGDPYMSKETAKQMVWDMYEKYKQGFIPFTWNGLNFDFKLLASYSGEIKPCAEMALNGIDGMFLVVAQKGYMLGLDKVLIGCGVGGKLHSVTLKDGAVYDEMSGKEAPRLWQQKEFDAVKAYLNDDVVMPLRLANHILKTKFISWRSNAGKQNYLKTEMLTVLEALKLPTPDTSWMTTPVRRQDFYSWIPAPILYEHGIRGH